MLRRDRSNGRDAQAACLLALTRQRPHHTHELRKSGISHPAGRIQDLEEMGFVFSVHRVTTVDSDGFLHRGVALYTLLGEPKGGAA